MDNGLDVGIRTQANEHPHFDTTIKSWEHDHDQAGGTKGMMEREKQYCAAQHAKQQQSGDALYLGRRWAGR